MALQPQSIKTNGMVANSPYIAISKMQTQKGYLRDESGSIAGSEIITRVWIGGAIDQAHWRSGDRFNINHQVEHMIGDLTMAEAYTQLKTMQVPMFELDLTSAVDILE